MWGSLRCTHSRMCENENSGWSVVSCVVWILWFEFSNVLSMLCRWVSSVARDGNG